MFNKKEKKVRSISAKLRKRLAIFSFRFLDFPMKKNFIVQKISKKQKRTQLWKMSPRNKNISGRHTCSIIIFYLSGSESLSSSQSSYVPTNNVETVLRFLNSFFLNFLRFRAIVVVVFWWSYLPAWFTFFSHTHKQQPSQANIE